MQPKITCAVNYLSQFLNSPWMQHYNTAILTLRFLQHTITVVILFLKCTEGTSLCPYLDADWATCPTTRRLVGGFVVLWNDNVVSWKSYKQPTFNLSTTEAEYKVVGEAVKEVLWIKGLATEIFEVTMEEPAIIHEDNDGCARVAINYANHAVF